MDYSLKLRQDYTLIITKLHSGCYQKQTYLYGNRTAASMHNYEVCRESRTYLLQFDKLPERQEWA
jgi:hypothetical protein